MIAVLNLFIGFGLLLIGSNGVVRSGIAIASRFRISPLVVGATIIAVGTSLPEFVFSSFATIGGQADMAMGNLIGANIANIGFIFGLFVFGGLAIIGKTKTQKNAFIYTFLSIGIFLSLIGNGIGIVQGLLLFSLGILIIFWEIQEGKKNRKIVDRILLSHLPKSKVKLIPLIIVMGLSIIGITVGGKMLVFSAESIASTFTIPDTLIGLTVITFGTTLPELSIAISALQQKKAGQQKLVVGNTLGTVITNVLIGMGLVGILGGYHTSLLLIDLCFLIFSLLFCLIIFVFKGRSVSRWVGGGLLILYAVYNITVLIFS